MNLEIALAHDRRGALETAASAYEALIEEGDPSLTVLLNLAILYWQARDPGHVTSIEHKTEFFELAGFRHLELLQEAADRYPAKSAAIFWKQYVEWLEFGDSLDPDCWRKLLRERAEELDPALGLFMATQGEEARKEALELLAQCQRDETVRSRYVVSVIESTLKMSTKKG